MATWKKGRDLLPEWENFVQNKDENAFHRLYKGYYHYFHFIGLKKGFQTSVIEDAISDLFLYVWENTAKLDTVRNHHNYLITSFINKITAKKNIEASNLIDFMEITDLLTVPSPEFQHITGDVSESVSQIISNYVEALPPQQKLMIYQKFFLNLSYNEISKANNVSVRTAYNTIFRAIATLKTLLNNEKSLILGLISVLSIIFLLFFRYHW